MHLVRDFKASYDSIDRTRLCLANEKIEIVKKLINMITVTVRNAQY